MQVEQSTEPIKIEAQKGPQWQALESTADILIFGGSAGGGKTIMLLFEMLKWIKNPMFRGVIFRRESPQITKEGGLWDTSQRFYPLVGGQGVEGKLLWRFQSGASVGFDHLQLDRDVEKWQGSQIPAIFFDELVHFTERQFFYMMSRNRSASGIPGYMRATCNPDPDSWVAKFISWWLDPNTGYPIPERSGVLRWFVRINENLVWADTKEELIATYGQDQMPKSVTFIPSKVTDNKILMKEDPTYISNLMALPAVDRARLLKGNWKVRATAGTCFQRSWFPVVPFSTVPMQGRTLRYWDRASSIATPEHPDPDWTVGTKIRRTPDGRFFVMHVERFRDRPLGVKTRIKNIASSDSTRTEVALEGDPASAGDFEIAEYMVYLAGFVVKTNKPTKNKYERAKPAMTQAEAGNIILVEGDWNDAFLSELENFSDDPDSYSHDDQVDTLSGGIMLLTNTQGGFTSAAGIRVGQNLPQTFDVGYLSPADLGL